MNQAKVVLRAVRTDDAALLFDWINDRELLIQNASYRPTAEEDHQAWFRGITRRSDLYFFIIEETRTSRAIGSCQLLNVHWVHRSADLQIRIAEREAQGRGLGSEAIEKLLRFGFDDLGLHRIALQVFATNTRAIRAYVKNGLVEEGRLREAVYIDGQRIDLLCMARLKADHG